MFGGFVRGIIGKLLGIAGGITLLIWLLTGFAPDVFVLAVVFFVAGAFLTYVSRHTVLVANAPRPTGGGAIEAAPSGPRRPCPSCAEDIIPTARLCRFCKELTGWA